MQQPAIAKNTAISIPKDATNPLVFTVAFNPVAESLASHLRNGCVDALAEEAKIGPTGDNFSLA